METNESYVSEFRKTMDAIDARFAAAKRGDFASGHRNMPSLVEYIRDAGSGDEATKRAAYLKYFGQGDPYTPTFGNPLLRTEC